MVSLYRNAAAILPRHLLANAGILTLTAHTDCVGSEAPYGSQSRCGLP